MVGHEKCRRCKVAIAFCCHVIFSAVIVLGLVAVPERRAVTTLFVPSQRHRLFLESSPLLGGPLWLPLHVKVVLESWQDRTIHRWDAVPRNATEIATLQRLLTLQAVHADVRYQRAPMASQKWENEQVISGYDIVIRKDIQKEYDENAEPTMTTKILIDKAQTFCGSYPEDMQLLRSNCWSFAFQLYDILNEEMGRLRSDDDK
jgi:hypothetical protein